MLYLASTGTATAGIRWNLMSQGTFGWRSLRNIRTWQRPGGSGVAAWLQDAPRSILCPTGCRPHSRTLPLVLPQLWASGNAIDIDPPLFPLPGDGQNRVKNLLQGTRRTLPSGIVPRMTTQSGTDTPPPQRCAAAGLSTPRQSLLEQSYCQPPPDRSVQHVQS